MKKLLACLLSLTFIFSLTACLDTEEGSYDYEEDIEPEYTVDIKVKCEENLIFSKYDIEVYFDDILEGNVEHGKTEEFSATVTEGTYSIDFKNAEDSSICETVEVDVMQDESLEFKVKCKMFGIEVETVKGTNEKLESNSTSEDEESVSDDTEIIVTENAKDLIGLNKDEVGQKFKDMGFEKIEYKNETTETNDKNNEVKKVEIVYWIFGDDDFKKGDKFGKDEEVVITYYEYKEPEKPSPVYYSTNDHKTACEGKTGVFAYRSSGEYDVYWIIDFDEGYVYTFTQGNSNDYCDKVKITSGTLNDKVTITWKEGKTKWYLYFKYVSAPSILISRDHLGIMVEFSPTNLDKALQLRNTKTIVNS